MATATEPHHRTALGPAAVTEVAVDAGAGHGHPGVSLRTGLLAPRLLGTSPGVARVALVSTTATLLGGDVVDLRIRVGSGQWLELVDVAATVAYDGRGRAAAWSVRLTVEPGATLVWSGEPLVVANGADVTRSMRIDVARGGRLLLRDVVVLGRHGEHGGSLRCRTEIWHDDVPLLVEELALGNGAAGLAGAPGVMGPHRVAETLTCVADPLPQVEQSAVARATVMSLPGPGVVARHLGGSAHCSPLDPAWRLLEAQVRR